MLSVSSYPTEYLTDCRATVRRHLDAWERLPLSAADRSDFEPGYVQQLILALDNYFTHRGRGAEGKDGNPLNEVRMLCTSIREHDGRLAADKSIRYRPEAAVLGLRLGDPITIDVAAFRRLAEAFLDEIEKRFPG